MITIYKAILHILDGNSGMTVFSDNELNFEDTNTTTYVTKLIEKAYKDANMKKGTFLDNSALARKIEEYRTERFSFRELSVFAANRLYEAISQSENIDASDLIVCDFATEEHRMLALIKCNNKMAYTHEVRSGEDSSINTHIVNAYSILPAANQKIDELALIDLETMSIRLQDKKRSVNGKEVFLMTDLILECTTQMSSKEAMKTVNTIAQNIAESHGEPAVAAVSKAKSYMVEALDDSPFFDAEELGKEVFGTNSVMQAEYMEQIKEAGIPQRVNVPKTVVTKAERSHRIKTDTGIEITFPVEFFDNSEYIEFISSPDGKIRIELKNINNIENK
ncbi:MAG: nucleoid-associated protein [Oscillospiraceae bacterium]|nr:nucleoid-associated protein [Oscillospiraceae bacterium]